MDLLEIRKKATGLKAEEEEAARKAAGSGVPAEPVEASGAGTAADAEGPSAAAPADTAAAKPKAKKPGARKKKAKAPEPAPEPEPGPEVEPGLGDEEPPAPEAGDEGTVMTADAPAAEPPVREQPPPASTPPPAEVSQDTPGEGGESGEGVVEYLAFRLGSEEYAVKVEDVREIIRLQKITGVPRAQGFVSGIISLRGVIIPIFDIKKRLGFEDAEHTRSTRIVVVAEDGMPQGIIVDKVTGVVRFPVKTIEPPPAVIGGVEAEYIQGVGRIGDRLLILFNTGRVLAMEG